MLDIFIPMLGESYTAGAGGGGGGPTGDAPSGLPSNGTLYTYASTTWQPGKWGAQWTNGDATANTQIDYNGDESVVLTAPPGATWLDLGISVSNNPSILDTIRMRHTKSGQVTAWVSFVAV